RTFARCDLLGKRIADAALLNPLEAGPKNVHAARGVVPLLMNIPSQEDMESKASGWAETCAVGPSETRAVYETWLNRAKPVGNVNQPEWMAPVTVFIWGPSVVVALPGEPFARASVEIRRRIASIGGAKAVLVLGYSDGCPGYLPSCDEYQFGGYEVEQAHHYYGMPGAFAQGSLERLIEEAVRLSQGLFRR